MEWAEEEVEEWREEEEGEEMGEEEMFGAEMGEVEKNAAGEEVEGGLRGLSTVPTVVLAMMVIKGAIENLQGIIIKSAEHRALRKPRSRKELEPPPLGVKEKS